VGPARRVPVRVEDDDGDFILQTRVLFAGKGVDPHRKAG
jgi:hypothetical protein